MYVFRCPRCSCTLLTSRLDPMLSVGKQMLVRAFSCSSKLAKTQQSSINKHTEELESDCINRRMNPSGIQMLSKQLHKQIFGDFEPAFSRQAINRSRKHLKEHSLWGKEGSILPDINVKLPQMLGSNINEHFENIAKMQCEPYINLALTLAGTSLPPMPKEWQFEMGWTRYDPKTGEATKVDCPEDNALIFDVEVCVTESPRSILATAASPTHWYSWVSRRLCSDEDFYAGVQSRTVLEDLIPMESVEGSVDPVYGEWQERLVVGHNVSYDRARIKEQYLIKGPKTKFLDTMSLHVCVAGQTTHQKIKWLSTFKKLDNKEDKGSQNNTEPDPDLTFYNKCGNQYSDPWMDVSSPNSLAHVHRLYAGGGVRKDKRDVFVKGSVMDIRNDFQNLMKYCAKDVFYTHEVLQKVLPLFLKRCPHPVTLAGMFEMGSAYLPVDHSWEQYLDDTEYTYEEMQNEMRAKLMALADNACSYMHNDRYTNSLWLCNLDWSTKKFRGKAIKSTKAMKDLLSQIEQHYQQEAEEFEKCDGGCDDIIDGSEERFKFLISSKEPRLPSRPIHMPGYPEWYRALCMKRTDPNWRPGAVNVTAQTRVTPYLLRMKWNGHPLYHHSKLGWGYIIAPKLTSGKVPNFGAEDVDYVCMENKVEGYQQVETGWGLTDDVVTLGNGEQFYYFKIPHKDGADANCGNPLSKDYLSKMEDGTLTSGAGHLGQRILTLNSMMSFWRSARSRILQQFVVWLGDQTTKDTPFSDATEEETTLHKPSSEVGAILPIVQVAGTATRRAVEPTWLTASNAKETRVGSEQKAMIRSPPGYHFVGADVDSQELWIAAVLGDMHFAGIHGSTAIGWMTLQGKKSDGTDVHSNTAKTIGVSRDHAKILNYGRIYGAGKPFMELLLAKFNPSLTSSEVKEKADLLLTATKGRRMYKLPKKHHQLAQDMNIILHDGYVDYEDWKMIRDVIGYFNTERGLTSRVWVGGSESQLFNKLESIAMSNHPRTPVLHCSISKALEKDYVKYEYQPSKINWVVQSSAVDYLHLMLVFNRWLFDKYNIDGRFCISIHDEVRYLVKSEDRYRAALALQYSNLFTRAMFSYQLRMYDLPQSVAFFSAVDIDTVLRKEATMDCKTPSNPLGLERGHSIPFGEVLDIYQILEKTGGSLSK